MDSNVSKETFLHKFFKLRFIQQQTSLSVRELLKQMLLSTLDLFQPRLNLDWTPQFKANTLGDKIVLLHTSIESISSKRQNHQVLLTSKYTPIVYSSSIALAMADQAQKKPRIVAEELVGLLVTSPHCVDSQFGLNLIIKITNSGLINFYLDTQSVAIWLEQSLTLLKIKNPNMPNLSLDLSPTKQLDSTSINLFPAQYVHARCCSLLRLGAREKLLIFKNNNSRGWLDEQNNLWLNQESEFILLRQLFLVVDSLALEVVNWHKLALNLSTVTMIFLADCRFLGVVQQETPQKAIARLRLIALTQYWLQKLLVEKLNIAAPTSL
jgi:arginyl-tRNA synthetase